MTHCPKDKSPLSLDAGYLVCAGGHAFRVTLAQVDSGQAKTGTKGRKCKEGEKAGKSAVLEKFLFELSLLKLPEPVREYVFHGERRWRLDTAFPEQKIAIEYQGIFGERTASHASIGGLMRDYRKWTEAALLGWIVILVDAASVESGEAHKWVGQAFELRKRRA